MHKACLKLEHKALTGPHKEWFSASKASWYHVNFTKWLKQLNKEKEEILTRDIVDLSLLGASAVVDDENETYNKEKAAKLLMPWDPGEHDQLVEFITAMILIGTVGQIIFGLISSSDYAINCFSLVQLTEFPWNPGIVIWYEDTRNDSSVSHGPAGH